MLDELRRWAANWGDIASIAGLGLSLIGFAVTILGVWRSQTAAEQARNAANAVKASIAHYDTIADLSSAVGIMDEIKRLHRQKAWGILPDRYGELRRRLIALKSYETILTGPQRQIIQETIEKLADLDRRVERCLSQSSAPPNPAKLNEIVTTQLDLVHAVLAAVQRASRSEQ